MLYASKFHLKSSMDEQLKCVETMLKRNHYTSQGQSTQGRSISTQYTNIHLLKPKHRSDAKHTFWNLKGGIFPHYSHTVGTHLTSSYGVCFKCGINRNHCMKPTLDPQLLTGCQVEAELLSPGQLPNPPHGDTKRGMERKGVFSSSFCLQTLR